MHLAQAYAVFVPGVRLYGCHRHLLPHTSGVRPTLAGAVPPTTRLLSPHRRYMTDAPVILFQMIDQQVDVAFQPGGGSEFASALLRHCFTTLKTFHAEYIANLMKVEAVLKNGQEQATHLPEFLMAAVNNNAKARVYISQVQAKIEEHLEAEIQVNEAEVMQELKRISQGFHRVSSMAVELLVELVFADLADACLQLYNQKWMRANTAIETIFATLNDYGGDFEEHVTPAYYTAIMSKCRTELLVAYIQAMLKKKLNVRSEDDREVFISRLEEETNLIRTAFVRWAGPQRLVPRQPARADSRVAVISTFCACVGGLTAQSLAVSIAASSRLPPASTFHVAFTRLTASPAPPSHGVLFLTPLHWLHGAGKVRCGRG